MRRMKKNKYIGIRIEESVMPNIPDDLVEKANALYQYLMTTRDTLGEQLHAIYQYLDIFRPYLAPYMSCSKGCSHCCHIDVQLSPLEAAYIQMRTGVVMSQPRSITTGHTTPCPFLSEAGACGIYEARPLACRIFHAMGDPENCRPGRNQIQYGHPPNYGNDIFANLMRWMRHQETQNNWSARDIRDFFAERRG